MGRASAGKATRGQQRALAIKALREQRDRLEERPDIVEVKAAVKADADLHARLQADAPLQRRRLINAGWHRHHDGRDGLGGWVSRDGSMKMIHSVARWEDGKLWGHISLSRLDGKMPDWYALSALHRVVYPDLTGVQVVAPLTSHVDIAEVAHTWTCLTASVIPDFGKFGTI